jgi:Replication-relaxation
VIIACNAALARCSVAAIVASRSPSAVSTSTASFSRRRSRWARSRRRFAKAWDAASLAACLIVCLPTTAPLIDEDSHSPTAFQVAELARLVERVVERLERRQGELGRGSDSWTYALGPTGQRLSGDGSHARRPALPSQPTWQHAMLGAEIYARLAEATRATDREVALWQGEPDCWRNYPGPYGGHARLKPDAFVIVSGPDYEDMAFVEFDTGTQSRTVMRSKIEAYRRYRASGQEQGVHDGVFPLMVIITTSLVRQDMLLNLLTFVPTEDRRLFAVGQLADAPRLLMGVAS